MTDKSLSYILRSTNISSGKVIRTVGDLQAVELTKRVRFKSGISVKGTFIFVLKANKKAGIIYKMGTKDIHFYVFKQYRNQGVLSNILRDNFLKTHWSDLTKASCSNPEDEGRIRHLIEISGLTYAGFTEDYWK